MKKVIIFSNSLILAFVFTSFFNQVNAQTTTTKKNTTGQQATKKYTCTIHPEVVMDKPGKCPKCGMTLVEKTDTKPGGMQNMQKINNMHDMNKMHDMKNMENMQDSTMMKHDSTKMKKCC